MKLHDVYSRPESEDVLWALLAEREAHQSISHRKMPTLADHRAFIASRPYAHWYLIDCGDIVGATYLTRQREIGIGILTNYRRNGYAINAIRMLMQMHRDGEYAGRRFLANISHQNADSIAMFRALGFSQIQVTYAID